MSTFYDTIIRIISKPTEQRNNEEILFILTWFLNLFKRKSAIFGDIKTDVIKDIIKNCSFETKNQDEIIIKQGDVGDCFYITLRGKVSIYINHKKHDETDSIESEANDDPSFNEKSLNEFENSLTSSLWSNPSLKSKKLREKLGNYVTSLGPGEGFGEVALVRDEPRTATIIADEKTDLMVVNKTLYSRCLQATTLRKLNEKTEFINKSPFFGNWQPKMKKLLSLCLERDIVPYDSYLGKQGESADRMYFIISGQAKLIVNPSAHVHQFPKFYPLKLPENENQEVLNSLIEERMSKLGQQSPRASSNSNNSSNLSIKRRSETFAEAEQRRKSRQLELGILGPGEISGMCELILDMPTYMQSTRCLETCDVFYIFKRSYDRLIAKRNAHCIGKMKSNVLVKLSARNHRMPIELFRSLEYKLRLQMKQAQTTGANGTAAATSSSATLTTTASSSSTSPRPALFPPRGAFVQPTCHTYMRPKSKLLNRAKKQKETSQQQEQQQKLVISGVLRRQGEADEPAADETETVTVQPILLDANQNVLVVNAGLDVRKLELLEEKIKKWQLDLGCKKAFVTKMNRIELNETVKRELKMGGSVQARRTATNTNSSIAGRLVTASAMMSFPASDKLLPARNNRSRSSSSFSNSSEATVNSESNEGAGAAAAVNRGENNFLRHVDLDSRPFLALQSLSANVITTNNLLAAASSAHTFLHSFLTNMTCSADDLARLNEQLTSTFAPEFPSWSNVSLVECQQQAEGSLVPGEVAAPAEATKTTAVDFSKTSKTTDATTNKRSTSYCFVKRKFSMSQVKIQSNGGKKYSKEEYLALKDELKRRQTRRSSIPACFE